MVRDILISHLDAVKMIICEIGQNFCGQIPLAKDLIRLAKLGGADLCKFQLYDHNELYKDHPEIPNVELSFKQAKMLFEYGKEVGIEVFFSVFDVERVEWCEEIGVRRYKIACSQNDNKRLLGYLKGTEFPVIVSMDSSSFRTPEINGCNWHYLFCVSKYPAEVKDYLCYNSPEYRCFYEGISDHTIGIDASKIALARGAQIIEKHFCFNHSTGIDAPWSMDVDELRELVRFQRVVKECP